MAMTQDEERDALPVEDRIKRWRKEDSGDETEGHVELLCDAEEELGRLRNVSGARVEKMAEAIFLHEGGVGPEQFLEVMGSAQKKWKIDAPWDTHPDHELCEHERDEYRLQARAALDALGLKHG
jgi:hypothetical protein